MSERTQKEKDRVKRARINRRKARKKQDVKARNSENVVMNLMEKETEYLLDPEKNPNHIARPTSDLDNKRRVAPKKLRDKVTWADYHTSYRGLGVKVPTASKSDKERKRERREKEKAIVEAKAAKLQEEEGKREEKEKRRQMSAKKTKDEVKEDGEVGNGIGEHEVTKFEGEERPTKRMKVEDGKPESMYDILQNAPKEKPEAYDLWGKKGPKQVKKNETFIHEFLHHNPKKYKPHSALKTTLRSVIVADPGQSYRPSPEAIKKIKAKERKEHVQIQQVSEHANAILANKEAGHRFLLSIDNPNAKHKDENNENDEEELPIITPKMKSKAQRQRHAAHNDRQGRIKQKKEFERRQEDIDRVDEILEEIQQTEEKTAQHRVKKEQAKIKNERLPRSTDNKKVEKRDPLLYTTSPTGHLHAFKTIINPLKDRMLSFHKRGLVIKKSGGKQERITRRTPVHSFESKEYDYEDKHKYLIPAMQKAESDPDAGAYNDSDESPLGN